MNKDETQATLDETIETSQAPEQSQAPQVQIEDAQETIQISLDEKEKNQDDPKEPPKETTEDYKQKYLSQDGKIKALENEKNIVYQQVKELEEKAALAEQYEKALVTYQSAYKNKPDQWEAIRQEIYQLEGRDIGSHNQVFGGSTLPNQQGNQPQVQAPNIAEVVEKTIQKRELDKQLETGVISFLDEVNDPDLDYRTNNPNDPEYIRKGDELAELAGLASHLRRFKPTLTIKDSFIEAYEVKNKDKVKQQAQELGEIIGRKSAYGTPSVDSAGSASTKAPQRVVSFKPGTPAYDSYNRLLENSGEAAAKRFAAKFA